MSTRRTTTSATSGGPTPACSPRCTSCPRSAEQELPLSQFAAQFERYVASGEINSEVHDQTGRTEAVREAFGDRPGVEVDELDGLTVTSAEWWFNLRASNTEPLLRLNVEATTHATMAAVRDEVLALVRKER